MTQTDTATGASLAIPSGKDIYDAIMFEIDSDLLVDNIPGLDEKYKGETPEEKAARYARYKTAYKKYDKAFAAWLSVLKTIVQSSRIHALRTAEEQNKAQENNALAQLESSISSQSS